MSESRSRYDATPADGGEILRILESSAAKGSIELIYTRRPDAWLSYQREPGEARVFVSREEGCVVGTAAELIRSVYIGGEECRAAYLCGLKKDAEFAGSAGFGPDFIRDLQRDDIDFYYCSVVAENRKVRDMFEKPRRIISMTSITTYKTYILNPKVRIKAPKHSFTFRKATEKDAERLLDFLADEGRKKDMFPVIHRFDEYDGLRPKDFCLLLDGDSIVAAAALWDQTAYKQYVVKRYGKFMKSARIVNPLLAALRYVRLPRENVPLRFPILSFLLCKNDSTDICRIFLKEIKREVAKEYGMFVIGLPKEHFAARILDTIPNIHFSTELYEIRFPWSRQAYPTLCPSKAYFECGLL